MFNTKSKSDVDNLLYWLTEPFVTRQENKSYQFFQKTVNKLKENEMYSEAFDKAIEDVEIEYLQNKMQYSYVQRRQVEKNISKLKGYSAARLINNTVVPTVNKAVNPIMNS